MLVKKYIKRFQDEVPSVFKGLNEIQWLTLQSSDGTIYGKKPEAEQFHSSKYEDEVLKKIILIIYRPSL